MATGDCTLLVNLGKVVSVDLKIPGSFTWKVLENSVKAFVQTLLFIPRYLFCQNVGVLS